jgi:ATP-binding cassette subfamily F protein 3
MAPSDLLLLDEPTNHLDLDATLWLERWLPGYRGTLMLISHDRDFIDATCDQVLHIEHRKVSAYRGNYTAFEKQRAERLATEQAGYEKQRRRMAEIDAFVRRFRYKASKARQAQSRLKELERMQALAPAHADSPFHFEFLEPERASDPVLQLSDVAVGYGKEPVLEAVSLNLCPGDRIGLLGRNGAGKSTLLKSLMGTLPLLAGERVEGAHCRIGYFDQHQLEALDLEASPLTHLLRLSPQAREQDMLNFLGGFAFGRDLATAPVKPLSGGEKTRLALAIVVWQRPNLLVMDEPTNHLDMAMRHALTLALQRYQGALILVTHDRHLLRNTVDSLLLVDRGKVAEYTEDISAYERWVLERQQSEEQNLDVTAGNAGTGRSRREERQLAAARRSQLRPIKQRIARTEQALADIEARLAELAQRLADSNLYDDERKPELDELLREEGQLRKQSQDLEEAWLEQNEELEKLEAG